MVSNVNINVPVNSLVFGTTVNNLAELSQVNTSYKIVWVNSLLDMFTLVAENNLEPDGITIIEAKNGERWMRQGLSNKHWQTHTEWYIDSENGNDENKGDAEENALRTFTELNRRIGGKIVLNESVTIWIKSDLDDSIDKINSITVNRVNPDAKLYIRGIPKIIKTGTLSSYTHFDPDNNQEPLIVDNQINWTEYEGKIIRLTDTNITSSILLANPGDAGTDAAMSSAFYPLDIDSFAPGSVVNLNGNEDYEILDLPKTNNLHIKARGYGMQHYVVVEYLNVGGDGVNGEVSTDVTAKFLGGIGFLRCSTSALSINSKSGFQRWVASIFSEGTSYELFGTIFLNGCGAINTISGAAGLSVRHNSTLFITGSNVFHSRLNIQQFASCFILPGANPTHIGFFYINSDAINLYPLSKMYLGNASLFGKGNSARGLDIETGSTFLWQTIQPTITGNGGDVRYEGFNVFSWDDLPRVIGVSATGVVHNAPPPGSYIQKGRLTLENGTAVIDGGITLNNDSIITLQVATLAGSELANRYIAPIADRVNGGIGTAKFEIKAVGSDGSTTVSEDVSTIEWSIIN